MFDLVYFETAYHTSNKLQKTSRKVDRFRSKLGSNTSNTLFQDIKRLCANNADLSSVQKDPY